MKPWWLKPSFLVPVFFAIVFLALKIDARTHQLYSWIVVPGKSVRIGTEMMDEVNVAWVQSPGSGWSASLNHPPRKAFPGQLAERGIFQFTHSPVRGNLSVSLNFLTLVFGWWAAFVALWFVVRDKKQKAARARESELAA